MFKEGHKEEGDCTMYVLIRLEMFMGWLDGEL